MTVIKLHNENAMARPRKTIDWETVKKRMEAGNSAATICDLHDLDTDTFYLRFKEHFGENFQDYSARMHCCGKSNIAFTQYTRALEGNTNMLTLLGREWLGQGKEQESKPPYQDLLELTHANMILRAEIAEMRELLNANKSQTG